MTTTSVLTPAQIAENLRSAGGLRSIRSVEQREIQRWEKWYPTPVPTSDGSAEGDAFERLHFVDRAAEAKRLMQRFTLDRIGFRSTYFEHQAVITAAQLASYDRRNNVPSPVTRRAPSDPVATARSFRVAVDALPVGKDIRNRLLAHIDAHIAALEGDAG